MMQKQEMTIENITTSVQYGPHLKAGIEGGVKYFMASHFNKESKPNLFKDSFIQSSERTSKYLLQENDVLLTGKGNRLFAWAYTSDHGKVVPSSLFFVLKLDAEIINGSYLAEILNSDKIQHNLRLIGSGATIMSIAKGELLQLKVPVPSLSEQLKLVEATKILDKNIELTQKMITEKIKLKKAVINKLVKA